MRFWDFARQKEPRNKPVREVRSSWAAKNGSRDSVPCGAWGNAPTAGRVINCVRKVKYATHALNSEALSAQYTNFARPQTRPQLALPTTCILSRPLARPDTTKGDTHRAYCQGIPPNRVERHPPTLARYAADVPRCGSAAAHRVLPAIALRADSADRHAVLVQRPQPLSGSLRCVRRADARAESALERAVQLSVRTADAGADWRGTAASARGRCAGAPFADVCSLFAPRDWAGNPYRALRFLAAAGSRGRHTRLAAYLPFARRLPAFPPCLACGDCFRGSRGCIRWQRRNT